MVRARRSVREGFSWTYVSPPFAALGSAASTPAAAPAAASAFLAVAVTHLGVLLRLGLQWRVGVQKCVAKSVVCGSKLGRQERKKVLVWGLSLKSL